MRMAAAETGEALPLSLVCADRRQISPVVQALRTFLAERCAQHGPGGARPGRDADPDALPRG